MRDLGYMTFVAAGTYKELFDQQGIICEIKDSNPFLRVLFGGGWGNNKRVNLLVKDEDYERAQQIFIEEERKHVKRVAELTPAANRSMAIIGLVSFIVVFLFYWLKYMGK